MPKSLCSGSYTLLEMIRGLLHSNVSWRKIAQQEPFQGVGVSHIDLYDWYHGKRDLPRKYKRALGLIAPILQYNSGPLAPDFYAQLEAVRGGTCRVPRWCGKP